MSELAKNTFEGGIQQNLDVSITKPNTVLYTENIKIITNEDATYIVSNIKGTTYTTSLKSGYWIKGVKVCNEIAYILSVDPLTGRGELGSFPSPNYSQGESGSLTMDYRALRNYSGDNDEYPDFSGDMNSIFFNLGTESKAEIEIQQEYDGTVNIVIAYSSNSIRIINSRFVKSGENGFKIVDRTGSKDTNLYTRKMWNSTINLILRPSTISQVELIDLPETGINNAGNYTLYFKYTNDENNTTNIFAQTTPISIFRGSSPTSSNGIGINGDLTTTKAISVRLHNLDTTYSFVQVFICKEVNNDTKYYKLTKSYNIVTPTLDIIVTGNEDLTEQPIESIDVDSSIFNNVRTMTQIQNRLLVANLGTSNILSRSSDITLLRKFAACIIPKYKEIQIESSYSSNNISDLTDKCILTEKSLFADGRSWNGGYANAKNLYGRKGYWGGETYSLGVRYIFTDYSVSDVYPTFGYDDATSDISVLLSSVESTIDTLLNNNGDGYDTGASTYNINGVYRFPKRNSVNANGLVVDLGDGVGVNTFAVDFTIPPFDKDLGNGKTLLDFVIGIEFVRSERIIDCVTQGIGLSTYPFQRDPHTQGGTTLGSDSFIWNAPSGRGNWAKVMPLVKGYMPISRMELDSSGGSPTSICGPYGENDHGQFYDTKITGFGIMMHKGYTPSPSSSTTKLFSADKPITINGVQLNKFCGLMSPDISYNKGSVNYLLNDSTSLLYMDKICNQKAIAKNTDINGNLLSQVGQAGHTFAPAISLIKGTTVYKLSETTPKKIKSSIVLSQGVSAGIFTSIIDSERFLIAVFNSSGDRMDEEESGELGLKYGRVLNGVSASYCGIESEDIILSDLYGYNDYLFDKFPALGSGCWARFSSLCDNDTNTTVDPNDVGIATAGEQDYFNIFNVYKQQGLKSWNLIKSSYNVSVLKYTPISQKLFLYKNIVKEAVYDASVVASETSFTNLYYDTDFSLRNSLSETSTLIKKPTFWGGDCIVGLWINKVTSNIDIPTDVDVYRAPDGVYVSVFLESNINSLLPNTTAKAFPFDPSGLIQQSDWINETYNSGFSKTLSKKTTLSRDFNAPFIKTEFDTRIYYSDIHVQNNFSNAYRSFGVLNYKDYSKHLGSIVRIVNIKNTLFMVQESGISVIPFNERVASAKDTAGEIYIGQADILSQYVGAYSEKFGTQFQFACIPTNDNLYVLDLNNFKFISLNSQRGIEFISDMKIEPFMRKYLSSFLSKERDITSLDIVGHDHSIIHKELVWTFYDKTQPDKLKNISIAYSLVLNQFVTFYSMIPYSSFNLKGIQYVTNFKTEQHKIHSLETNLTRNLIFDVPEESIIRFKVSDKFEFEKVFDNLRLISNNIIPKNIIYYVEGSTTDQSIIYDSTNIHLSNTKYREGVTYVTIPRVINITDKDVTEFLDSLYTNTVSQLNTVDITEEQARFRGKVLVVELHYDTDKQLKLNSIISQYRLSNS